MSDLKPWSQGLMLQWAPSVDFLEQRFSLLKSLRDAKAVRQFAVGSDSFIVRTSRARALEVGVDHLNFEDALGDLQQGDPADEVLSLVLQAAKPAVTDVQWSFQYLVALEGYATVQEACAVAARAVHGELADLLEMVDFAALIDGVVEPLGEYKMEFGVLPDEEAPLRLSRLIGRSITRTIDREMGLEVNADRTFPEVGLFVDLAWAVKVPASSADHPLEWLWALQQALLSRSAELVGTIYDRLVATQAGEHA
ncbi:hypothetical protein [Modestobacter sp. SYSU DS0875]